MQKLYEVTVSQRKKGQVIEIFAEGNNLASDIYAGVCHHDGIGFSISHAAGPKRIKMYYISDEINVKLYISAPKYSCVTIILAGNILSSDEIIVTDVTGTISESELTEIN